MFDRFAFADGLGGEMNGSLLLTTALPERYDQHAGGKLDVGERHSGKSEWNSECKMILQAKILMFHGFGRPTTSPLDSYVRAGCKLFGFTE
jgi:hypothetical protein